MLRLFLVLLFCISLGFAQTKTLRFNATLLGYPPYLIFENQKLSHGIMLDVFEHICKKLGVHLEFLYLPRKRLEPMILNKQLDVTAMAKEWVDEPDNFIFTEPVVLARDIVFYHKNYPINFQHAKDLRYKSLRLHLGYHYPYFTKHNILNDLILSYDSSEKEMLEKVLLAPRRFQGAVVNELVGLYIIAQNRWRGKLLPSKKDLGSFAYAFMLNKEHAPFVKAFNQELKALKKSGELEKILQRYR